nr:hypothetical protein CFP56_53336 [Quercus suber]
MRAYESMISTIHKYPWFAHEFILLSQRCEIFDAAYACTRAILALVRHTQHVRADDPTRPTLALLQELVVAILTCPGFSEKQKHQVVLYLQKQGFKNMTRWGLGNVTFGGTSALAGHWPFLVLARNPKHSDRYIEVRHLIFLRVSTLPDMPDSGSPASSNALSRSAMARRVSHPISRQFAPEPRSSTAPPAMTAPSARWRSTMAQLRRWRRSAASNCNTSNACSVGSCHRGCSTNLLRTAPPRSTFPASECPLTLLALMNRRREDR